MAAIIRELRSGAGFKLSYQSGDKIESINFYYSIARYRQVGIIKDDRFMAPKDGLHSLLEVISAKTWNNEEANNLALFRTYQHVKNYVEHSFISNQPLIDKSRFASCSSFERKELLDKMCGEKVFI